MDSENLFVVKKIFMDPKSPREPSFQVTIPATFTHLHAAKEAAKRLLVDDGYDVEFFPIYDIKGAGHEWHHGDGVVVYAEGPSGERFQIEIETIPNEHKLHADPSGKVRNPLFHVVQTITDVNDDRSGTQRCVIVEGTHISKQQALDQAEKVLLDANLSKEDYVEYDYSKDGEESPYGADVVVHAVKEGGQNVLVSVIAAAS